MKKAYGQYIFSSNEALGIVEAMPRDKRFENIKTNLTREGRKNGLSNKEILDEIALHYNAGDLELDAKFGRCIHYFFTGEGMHEWFYNCAAPLTDEQSKIISKINYSKSAVSKAFMLHFLGGNSPVYLCRWVFNGIDIHDSQIKDITSLFIIQGKGKAIIVLHPDQETPDDEEMKRCQSVISSALAYIQCFPDMVKDGIPNDLKHPNYFHKNICKSIGMHESLINREGPCPHYRMGHFRFLSSEKFVHKKGQIIFVHGCFVKGKAMTVEGII